MLHPLRPGHLAHMNQAFDTLFQLDESSVICDAQNASLDMRADRVPLRGIEPWVRCKLLKAQRDTLFVFIELQNFYMDLVAHVHEVTGMGQAPPGHVSDVQKTVEPA